VHINFIPFLAVWVVMAIAVIAMLAWRKTVSSHDDETLHVMDVAAVSQQADVAHKLEVIDKWGKILTGLTVVFGLVLVALYFYQGWAEIARSGGV
jgi:hypothetical protein